jgi:cellulose synthase/poly-beta-1,6-N-acetylglucosamine synthase-like glycosyltransferase
MKMNPSMPHNPTRPWRLFWSASMPMLSLILIATPGEAQAGQDGTLTGDWTQLLIAALMVLFAIGILQSVVTYARARTTLRQQIDRPKPRLDEVAATARENGRALPFFLILVPARDESAVIANTITRLAQLNYPRERYAVVVICDERERGRETTTQEIAARMTNELNAALVEPLLYVIEVPAWFSGRLGDDRRTYARSTKGRALNYALGWVRDHYRLSRAEMIGILDADGRLHPDVLCEAANGVLTRNAVLLQGPVFQISNFADVGLVGKAAGIELSVYHLSTLSRRLLSRRDLPRFLAGTNYFVKLGIMLEAGGWNEHALVEDAELGLRLFLRSGVRPEWLSSHEIEQTSPDRRVYVRQRERWVLGHFQLLPQIRACSLPWHTKIYLHGIVVGPIFKAIFDAGLPVLGWIALVAGWSAGMPSALTWTMLGLLIVSIFVWDSFGRGAGLLNGYAPRLQDARSLLVLRLMFLAAIPWLMVVQAQPRITGCWKYFFGRATRDWEKTPRTTEALPETVASEQSQIVLEAVPSLRQSLRQ